MTNAPREEYFDSANIAESYSGIVLPLTYSFAKAAYEKAYRDLLHASGVSRAKIQRHADVFENLLGLFYGRMYYCMNNWYRMAEFAPGYRRNKRNFELMITSNVKEEVAQSIRPSLVFRLVYPLVVAGKVALFGWTATRFKRNTEKNLRQLRRSDFSRLTYAECRALFERMNGQLLNRWYVTLENDFFVMTYLGLLKKLLTEEQLHRALTFRSKATEQVDALAELSTRMSESKQVWSAIEKGDSEAFTRALAHAPHLQAALAEYLNAFGGRFANELKLESVGVDEDTEKLFAVLKAYRGYTPRLPGEIVDLKLPLHKGILVRLVVRAFKKYASRREEFRLLRSNTFGSARRLFRRMGVLLTENATLEHPDDVFYLTLDEVMAPEAEHSTSYIHTIAGRKREYDIYRNVAPPVHFSSINGALPVPEKSEVRDATIVQARPASPGIVRGKVKIFKEFSMPSSIDFDILVTAHTDPGWTSLIALSKGLIIEHGGMLSHASIVARELGIPAVIGATHAMTTLTDNQMVEINGSTGTVTFL